MLGICAGGFGRGAATESTTVLQPRPEAGTEAETEEGAGARDRNPFRRSWNENLTGSVGAGILFPSFQFDVAFTCLFNS